ncbi:MAG: AsnC family transcriptional regulator [Alphaproteobacteria bacterium]|nr:AsnC family transcriptional regulator [Alphaproteobacteria bacterium]
MVVMDDKDLALVAALRGGLPVAPRPYADLGRVVGITEADVLRRLRDLQDSGVIRRFGAIVRHHEAGYAANAMVVLDIPDEGVAEAGKRLAAEPIVTLCYRRARALPDWPYGLYAMVHGRDRREVEGQVAEMLRRTGLDVHPHAVLFSRRRFKQTAGCYGRERAP